MARPSLLVTHYDVLWLVLEYVKFNIRAANRSRLVCRLWKTVIDRKIENSARRRLAERYRESHYAKRTDDLIPYWVSQLVCHGLFEQNLIKNSCGERGFEEWRCHVLGDISQNYEFFEHTFVYRLPTFPSVSSLELPYSDLLPRYPFCYSFQRKHSFLRSFFANVYQEIDLRELGFTKRFFNHHEPLLTVSLWVRMYEANCQVQCFLSYKIYLLFGNNETVIVRPPAITHLARGCWRLACHQICNYGYGLRGIRFCIEQAINCQFTGLLFKISLPEVKLCKKKPSAFHVCLNGMCLLKK